MNKNTQGFISLLLVCPFVLLAQRPSDRLNAGPINEPYLEHLVKSGIDSVRTANGLTPLANDSILYVASKHHADFMLENQRMTHDEPEDATKTPQKRAERYGAKHYRVGENVLKTPFNREITGKNGTRYDGFTYGGLANSMVMGWVNSPGHYKNIITPDYEVTGVTIAIDAENERMYACQKFAEIEFKYAFEESTTLFPYSQYSPPAPPTDFSGMDRSLQNHDHPWKLKHENDACANCKLLVNNKPQLTLRLEGQKFILRVENSEYVKKLITNKKDGLAVEIVFFEDYLCGNPVYYDKTSRRNGQCNLNGTVLEPLFRDDLYRGYKQRKTNKELKFLSYILKADSVPFSDRAYQYKLQRFDSEYFEIKLASLPKNLDGQGAWQHNLVYIQDGHVCHIDYFTGYCGSVVKQLEPVTALPLDLQGDFGFRLMKDFYEFDLSFEQNKATYSADDIQPLIASLENEAYTVDDIKIAVTTSIEGDSLANVQLQQKRAESIWQVFQDRQKQEIPVDISMKTDWDHFYSALKRSSKWRHLAQLNTRQLRDTVNNHYRDSLEYILKNERKANVKLGYSIDVTDENLEEYVLREYKHYAERLAVLPETHDSIQQYMDTLSSLQRFAHQMVLKQKLDTLVLAALKIPNHHHFNLSFAEHYFLFGTRYGSVFSEDDDWVQNRSETLNNLLKEHQQELSARFLYELERAKAEIMMQRNDLTLEDVQEFILSLEPLKGLYFERLDAQLNIDRINYNLHMHLLNQVFASAPEENGAMAYKSMNELLNWHLRYEPLSDSLVFQFAQMAVYYNNNDLALSIMRPYRDSDIVNAYALQLECRHPSSNGSERFYQSLIESSETMDLDIWCNLFMSECGIPFQAFDHAELREVFCEKCMEKNDYVKSLTD